MTKALLISAGTLSLILGIIGIIVPGLPTTPFILLSAGLYVRSSPVLYNKISAHRLTGHYLTELSEGINIRIRVFSTVLMWTMILVTSILVISDWKIRILLICLGIAGTVFKLKFLFTTKNKK